VQSLFSNAFESPLLRIVAFRCAAEDAGFEDTGPIRNDCFVVPRNRCADRARVRGDRQRDHVLQSRPAIS